MGQQTDRWAGKRVGWWAGLKADQQAGRKKNTIKHRQTSDNRTKSGYRAPPIKTTFCILKRELNSIKKIKTRQLRVAQT